MICEFRTQFEKPERVIAESGDAVKEEFVGRYDDRGHLVLEPAGQTNMYDMIQSHADSVDINILMQRYANGELDVLQRVQSMYADVTDMPKTMADLLNKVKAGEEQFNALPLEIRALFNHSMSEWLATAGSPEWLEKMGIGEPDIPTPSTADKADDLISPEEVS